MSAQVSGERSDARTTRASRFAAAQGRPFGRSTTQRRSQGRVVGGVIIRAPIATGGGNESKRVVAQDPEGGPELPLRRVWAVAVERGRGEPHATNSSTWKYWPSAAEQERRGPERLDQRRSSEDRMQLSDQRLDDILTQLQQGLDVSTVSREEWMSIAGELRQLRLRTSSQSRTAQAVQSARKPS